MKKIELQLTARQLNSLVYFFTFANQFYPKTREQRVLKSVLDEVMIKIQKKNVEVSIAATNLFSKPKKTKFTFKFYEANSLEQYLLLIENHATNEYDRNAHLFIKNKLNQQLA